MPIGSFVPFFDSIASFPSHTHARPPRHDLETIEAATMSNLNYALFEAPVGYAIFKIVHQLDSVSLKSQEARDATSDLAKFGKIVKLVNFSPFR